MITVLKDFYLRKVQLLLQTSLNIVTLEVKKVDKPLDTFLKATRFRSGVRLQFLSISAVDTRS